LNLDSCGDPPGQPTNQACNRLPGLSTQAVIDAAWAALGRTGRAPVAEVAPAEDGEYAPV
jgi:hypothetical protein